MSMDGDVGLKPDSGNVPDFIIPSLVVFFCAQDSFIDGIKKLAV